MTDNNLVLRSVFLPRKIDDILRNMSFRKAARRGDFILELISEGLARRRDQEGLDIIEIGVQAMREIVVSGEGATPEQARETELEFDRSIVRAVLLACAPKVLMSKDTVAEEAFITGRAIVGDRTNNLDASQLIKALVDKIEGLESDLDDAVEAAFVRGAEEWTKTNYPDRYLRLTKKRAQ